MATLGDNGEITYSFTIDTAGTYDVAVRLCYPFWDKNGIYVSLDGTTTHFTENRLWWPYWRSTFWTALASGVTLSVGTHTLKISVDVKGVQFYGFRVCDSFSEEPSAGEAVYSFSPRKFKDVDGNWVGPDRGFRLTLEMLRRKPDSALVWYEDFRDYGVLETNYWKTLSGSFEVWRSDEYSTERVYSQLDGSGQLAWSMMAFLTSTCGQGWRSRQAAADGRASSAATCSAALTTITKRWSYTTAPHSSAATARRSRGRRPQTSVMIRPCTRWKCVSEMVRCASIPARPTRCGSRQQSAAFPAAMPGTVPTTARSAN